MSNVLGRIDYISNPKRQEYLYAVYTNVSENCWEMLKEQNQHDYKTSGTKGECIEARELVIALPESFVKLDPDDLLKLFTEQFHIKYGVPCIAALHHNKAKTNYHIHLIFSERKLKAVPVKKVATRNMFYDETGKHVRTKKEILDQEGNIREGCSIIPKGSVYDLRLFETKEEVFKGKGFLPEAKRLYCELINSLLPEDQKMTVFDHSGPYLATKKIGKNNPMEAMIKADNKKRQEWNQTADTALVAGIEQDKLIELKRELITLPVRESIKASGEQPGILAVIIERAIHFLKSMIERILLEKVEERDEKNTEMDIQVSNKTVTEDIENLKSEIRRMDQIRQKMKSKHKFIIVLEHKLADQQSEYASIKNSILFHAKRKKELPGEIKMTEKKIEKAWKEYHTIPKEYGYKSVKEFNRSYTNLLETLAVAEKEQKEISTPKGSIRSRLAEKKQKILQSNDNQSPKPAHSRDASL